MVKSAPEPKDPDFRVWKVGYDQGERDGKIAMRGVAIDFVTSRYIDIDNGPERGTPEAKFMLDLLRELGEKLKVTT